MIFFKSLPSTVTVWQNFEKAALDYTESRLRLYEIAPVRLGAFSALPGGSWVDVGRCGCYPMGNQMRRRNDMPRYIWDTPPNEHSLFHIRRSRWARRGEHGRAVCFHCRTTVSMYEANDGEGVFNTHHDVDRGNGYAGRGAGRAMAGTRRIGPNHEPEICVGSHYPPIPLAYKFEDGSPVPYH